MNTPVEPTRLPVPHGGQLATLKDIRQSIDAGIERSVNLFLTLAAACGLVLFLALSVVSHDTPKPESTRLASTMLLTVAAVGGLGVARRWGARRALLWFSGLVMAVVWITALTLGTGVASSSAVVPAALIAILGFVVGPRVSAWATVSAIVGVGALAALQAAGLIPGLRGGHTPPMASYAIMLVGVFGLIGCTVTHFSRMLWRAMEVLEGARMDLMGKIVAQGRIHAALLESQTRLQAVLDHVPLAVIMYDPHTGRIHQANAFALKAHGAPDVEHLERHHLFGEAPYRGSDFRAHVVQVPRTGPKELQWKTRHADGRTIWWSVRLDLLPVQGETYVVCYAQDITARLAAEQALHEQQEHLEEQVRERTAEALTQQRRMEAIIDALPVTLNIKGRDGRYQLSNRLFEQACGLSKAQLIGCPTEALYPSELASRIRTYEDDIFAGKPEVRYEQTRHCANGRDKDLLVTKVPLRDDQGRPEAILTLGIDITDQKQLQRDLSAAKIEAERLARVKSDFLANMSHEIRTPLHGMLGMTQVGLMNPNLSVPCRPLLERIMQSGRHLLGVIDQVLDFSKIDADKLEVVLEPISPERVAEEACTLVEQRARDKGLELVRAQQDLPAAVQGDALRCRQILVNLLGNAIKFTESGRVSLTVRAQGDRLYYEVRDTGVGMSAEALQRIFTPFEQADSSTTRKFGGTGLGLSISRRLAQLMGGDLNVCSTPGRGSTFTLCLPLRPTAPGVEPVRAADHALDPGAIAPDLRGLTVLAVDDVDINRDILEGLLAGRGANVHLAADGQQAIERLRSLGPDRVDVVLMDVQMPGMDGVEATRHLHALRADLPVIALTAHALAEERARCMAGGMIGHVAKPFEAEDLVRAILQARHRPAAPLAVAPPLVHREPVAPAMPVALDLDAALRRCGGKTTLLHKLVQRFVNEQGDFAARCQHLVDQDQRDDARRLAHMLKGTAANLGLPGLVPSADNLEAALTPSGPPDVRPLITEVDTALQAHVRALQTWLSDTTLATEA